MTFLHDDVTVLYFTSLHYVILCSKNFITENIVKIAFSFPSRLLSLRILGVILANTKDLYKNNLRLETPVLIRILRLNEIWAF